MSIAQRFMQSPVFSQVYERAWRPVFTRMFSLGGSSTADYDRALTAYLARPGERMILDVACGPGNYSRRLADDLTGDGRCVGIDFSAAMLRTAARTNHTERTGYLRADAHAIPFADNTFDAVVCLAALYLIPDALPVIDELVRVTKPGGDIAIFTSVTSPVTAVPGVRELASIGGYRVFERDEITDRLRAAGIEQLEQTITGEGQYVVAVKSEVS